MRIPTFPTRKKEDDPVVAERWWQGLVLLALGVGLGVVVLAAAALGISHLVHAAVSHLGPTLGT